MTLTFRRTIPTRLGRLSLSKSGTSLSRSFGPVSLSSRGRGSVRLGRGVRWLFTLGGGR